MFTYSRHQALRRSAPPLVLQDVRGNPPDSATFVASGTALVTAASWYALLRAGRAEAKPVTVAG